MLFAFSELAISLVFLAVSIPESASRPISLSEGVSLVLPVLLGPRTVYNPRITSPDAGAVWIIGSSVTVTWDTSEIPDDATNCNGKIVLGHLDKTSGSENLDMDHPLANDFDLHAGHIEITVPPVDFRKDYIVVLFGDSGNKSPEFTIQRARNT